MAITKSYHAVPPPDQLVHSTQVATAASAPPPPAPEKGIDIDAWTLNALESLSVSPTARGTGVTLSIPLDAGEEIQPACEPRAAGAAAIYKPRKELVRRDSQKKREALLKGKEGSRRRQRWENGKRRTSFATSLECVEEEQARFKEKSGNARQVINAILVSGWRVRVAN